MFSKGLLKRKDLSLAQFTPDTMATGWFNSPVVQVIENTVTRFWRGVAFLQLSASTNRSPEPALVQTVNKSGRVRPPWDTLKFGMPMSREFVERRDGSFYLIGSRVPLAHLVREFQRGELPEAIRSHYPTLSLEQVYGAITFYLGAKEEVEEDITERERVEDEFTKTHPAPPHLKEKLERARQQLLARRT